MVAPDIHTPARKGHGALSTHCEGASRAGANGAKAKLAYALRAAEYGSRVIIGHARHHIGALLGGSVPCTHIGVDAGSWREGEA